MEKEILNTDLVEDVREHPYLCCMVIPDLCKRVPMLAVGSRSRDQGSHGQ